VRASGTRELLSACHADVRRITSEHVRARASSVLARGTRRARPRDQGESGAAACGRRAAEGGRLKKETDGLAGKPVWTTRIVDDVAPGTTIGGRADP
jgi:hypothetical protein